MSYRIQSCAVTIGLLLVAIPNNASAQFITPARENAAGGSLLQLGGIGSVSASDLSQIASSAAAQLTVVARPTPWIEMYGSFNKGSGLSTASGQSSVDLGGMLYPESGNSAFMGQFELGPYITRKTGDVNSRFDFTVFGNFASRTTSITRDSTNYNFGSGLFGVGAKVAWTIYQNENTIRLLGGIGYSQVFISESDIGDARAALNEPLLPKDVGGVRFVVAAQINALVVEAQFPNLSGRPDIRGLTGFQQIIRFYVVGKFLSLGSHASSTPP